VSRFGGDEFVILLSRLDQDKHQAYERVALLAEKIRKLIAEPIIVDGQELRTSASIGATLFCNEETSIETILKQADIAMYRAKSDGRDMISVFESSMEDVVKSGYWIKQELQFAIDRNQLTLHYQPIVAINTKEIIGAEALIRWQHPEKGNIPPFDFIPKAEESDLICAIGRLVLMTGCQLLRDNPGLAYLSVNIGKRHFESKNFIEELTSVLDETDISPDRLVIEITENLLLKNPQSASDKMKQIKKLGVKFALDDFGTGYSSLSLLKDLPIDILKIDRSFTCCIGEDQAGEAIVVAIISLSDALGLRVIVEGVEELYQVNFMETHNCFSAQGYYFSRPVTSDEITRMIEASVKSVN
jgi:predicted signal transduction protein with EAL and GGDEF domain